MYPGVKKVRLNSQIAVIAWIFGHTQHRFWVDIMPKEAGQPDPGDPDRANCGQFCPAMSNIEFSVQNA
jgi:hypothetical protein